MDKTLMQAVFLLNDPPYGSERSYNGLRLAVALAKQDSNRAITIFLDGRCGELREKGAEDA
jgi:sulfur relay (sulfurtransferase) complex TusBCD TusD component (DsrE family)